jgi:putative hydrolase of the HAD superfamily
VGVEKKLSPNPSLAKLLGAISFEKVIFTSAHRPHAQKVLSCLGVEQYFSSIFDISFTDYVPKPNPEPYEKILTVLGVSAEKCLMIEDTAVNLRPAKKLGMTTVLVSPDAVPVESHIDFQIADILEFRKILRTVNNGR